MKTEEIKCDGCSRDLTYTNNYADYYLVLRSMPKEHKRGSADTLISIEPPIYEAVHFCDLRCMDVWRDRERAKASAAIPPFQLRLDHQ